MDDTQRYKKTDREVFMVMILGHQTLTTMSLSRFPIVSRSCTNNCIIMESGRMCGPIAMHSAMLRILAVVEHVAGGGYRERIIFSTCIQVVLH